MTVLSASHPIAPATLGGAVGSRRALVLACARRLYILLLDPSCKTPSKLADALPVRSRASVFPLHVEKFGMESFGGGRQDIRDQRKSVGAAHVVHG